MLRVPRRRHERNDWEERAFCKAYEEATEHKTPWSGHGRHTNGDSGPGQHSKWEEKARLVLCHDDVGWHLRDDVADVKEGDARRPLDVGHVEVLLHTCQASIGDVYAIKIAASSLAPLLLTM